MSRWRQRARDDRTRRRDRDEPTPAPEREPCCCGRPGCDGTGPWPE